MKFVFEGDKIPASIFWKYKNLLQSHAGQINFIYDNITWDKRKEK
jgi:hypothetical protein